MGGILTIKGSLEVKSAPPPPTKHTEFILYRRYTIFILQTVACRAGASSYMGVVSDTGIAFGSQ